MAIEIRMPALSPTMEEGTLARWLVANGDKVRSGDVIAEIETDKATMEVEAVDDGIMGTLLVAAGTENVKVNAPIAMLLAEGEEAGVAIANTPKAAAARTPIPTATPNSATASISASAGAAIAAEAQWDGVTVNITVIIDVSLIAITLSTLDAFIIGFV